MKESGQDPQRLSARRAALEFGLTRDSILRAIHARQLPATRLGKRQFLVLREDVQAWLRRHVYQPSMTGEPR